MDINDLLKDAKDMQSFEFERKLNKLVRENHSFKNLDTDNKKVVMEIFEKWRPYLRKGIAISDKRVRDESHRLYKDRQKLGLTEEDMKDIKNIMRGFQGKDGGSKSSGGGFFSGWF